MSALPKFVRLPSGWIEDGGLKGFRWKDTGSDNLAALMTLAVVAHHIAPDTGVARITYTELSEKASLSRAKLSAGLSVLANLKIIDREPKGRSTIGLANYDPKGGWAMLPAKGLYHNGEVDAFRAFRLRQRTELDAMKLYFLFASRRDRDRNMALLSYDKIEIASGVPRNEIRRAVSLLSANGLVYVEHLPSSTNEIGVANGYRLAHLDPRRHMGTIGRSSEILSALATAE
jgi:DNA-binding transcriptional ArsR family regulator